MIKLRVKQHGRRDDLLEPLRPILLAAFVSGLSMREFRLDARASKHLPRQAARAASESRGISIERAFSFSCGLQLVCPPNRCDRAAGAQKTQAAMIGLLATRADRLDPVERTACAGSQNCLLPTYRIQ